MCHVTKCDKKTQIIITSVKAHDWAFHLLNIRACFVDLAENNYIVCFITRLADVQCRKTYS